MESNYSGADSVSEFGNKLGAICAAEMKYAKRDAERLSDMIERLANSLAFSIAMGCGGDDKRVSTILNGVDLLLAEYCASHSELAKKLGAAP